MTEQTPKTFRATHGVSKMTVTRWRNAGHVVVTDAGLIDVEATNHRLAAAGLGRFRAKQTPATGALAEQLRRREIALARLRRQEWDRRSEEFILAAHAEAAWREISEFMRRYIADTAPTLAARTATCRSMGAMALAVREVVYHALQHLSETEVATALPGPPDPPPEISDSASKIDAQTAKIGALALLRQLDVDIAASHVISVAGFAQTFAEACSRVRQRMLALEANLPPRLWGASPAVRLKVIEAAITEVLVEMPAHRMRPGDGYPTENTELTEGSRDAQHA